MTEKEVLKELEDFKKAIQTLKEKIAQQQLIINQSNNYMQKHNEQDKFDTIVQENMQAHIDELEEQLNVAKKQIESEQMQAAICEEGLKKENERLSQRILELQSDKGKLIDSLADLKDKTYHTIKHLVEDNIEPKEIEIADLRKDIEVLSNNDRKYSEDDLKKLLHKSSEKSKKKIDDLSKKNTILENELSELQEKYSNLEISNKKLENTLKEINAEKEIDQVLNGEITNSEIDQVLKQTKIIHPAEEQLEEMLDNGAEKHIIGV